MSGFQPGAARSGIHVGLIALLAWLAAYFDFGHDVFAAEPGLSYFSRVGGEHLWSVVFLLAANVGVIGLLAVNPAVRLVGVLIVASVHGIFAGCLLLSSPSALSGTYVIIAGMGYYLAYQQTRSGLTQSRRAPALASEVDDG